MKAIKMRIQKSSRWAAILLAAIVAIITSAVVANATQTITTLNAVKITYNLAAGGISAAITPATNTSVLVMGNCTSVGHVGTGQVSLVHIPSAGFAWVGLESQPNATITQGATNVAPTHIVYIESLKDVAILVASADTILIHNAGSLRSTLAGSVTLIW